VTPSNIVSKDKVLNLSLELQMNFVKMWCEDNLSSIEKQLEDAQCIQMIYFDLNEQVKEIAAENSLSPSEKEELFDEMQNEMISDFSVEEAKRFFIDVNDHTFSVVFYGSEHPLMIII